MKRTGMTRPVDRMGRIVIPKEIREGLGVRSNIDSFEIMLEDDKIILKKYEPTCVFCDSIKDSVEYNGKIICKECLAKLEQLNQPQDISDDTAENTLEEIIKSIE